MVKFTRINEFAGSQFDDEKAGEKVSRVNESIFLLLTVFLSLLFAHPLFVIRASYPVIFRTDGNLFPEPIG